MLNRTMPPPIVTAMCRTEASRPMTRSCWARWWASSSHSCTVTRVTCAPSPATTETTSLYSEVPACSSTIVARANRPTRTSRWPCTTSCRAAGEPDAHGLVELGVGGDVEHARRRHCGRRRRRRPGHRAPGRRWRATPRTDAVPSVTPSGSVSLQSRCAPVASSRNSAPSRSTGVNRHSSSRPVGCGKSATAYDVVRSARDWFGDHRRGAVGVRARGGALGGQQAHVSQLLLPSAAR